MNEKRGLSQIVSTVLLIVLTLALVAGVWTLVTNYVHSTLNHASSCNGLSGKISLNSDYTCFDSSSNAVVISVSRNQIAMDSLLISVANGTSSKSIYLSSKNETSSYVKNFPDNSSGVSMPGNESGNAYCFYGIENATSVEIAPKIGGNQCGVVDQINNLPLCSTGIVCK